MSAAFVHGFILALGLILPLGGQNVFVFNQGAVQPSFLKALPAIITASVCDMVLTAFRKKSPILKECEGANRTNE